MYSSSYVCLVINPKQHCQTLTTEIVKINTKDLGREILRSQKEGNFKGVSWKLRLINHHGLKEINFSNCIMPFYTAKNNKSHGGKCQEKRSLENFKHLCSKKRLEASELFDENLSAQQRCLPASCLACRVLQTHPSC